MPRLGLHSRNHSFPPSLQFIRRSTKALEAPKPVLPDIDDEPWLYYLEEDDSETDYLHFDAGILTGTESHKRKSQKFRSTEDQPAIRHHHGSFERTSVVHGFVPNSSQGLDIPLQRKRSTRGHRRIDSAHRHSWQEPSEDLFTVDEEIPEIIVSDYDAIETVEHGDNDSSRVAVTIKQSGTSSKREEQTHDGHSIGNENARIDDRLNRSDEPRGRARL